MRAEDVHEVDMWETFSGVPVRILTVVRSQITFLPRLVMLVY